MGDITIVLNIGYFIHGLKFNTFQILKGMILYSLVRFSQSLSFTDISEPLHPLTYLGQYSLKKFHCIFIIECCLHINKFKG